MKRVLIWNVGIPFKNAGGPAGYLYNIHEYLKVNPCNNILFLSELLNESPQVGSSKKYKEVLKKTCNNFWIFAFLFDIYNFWNLYKKKKISKSLDLNLYDVIHFHNVFSLIRYRDYLKDYKGKILLTSHMPEPPISELSYSFKVLGPFLRKHQDFIIQKELNIIKKFNPIWMFPVKDAMEPYVNKSRSYCEYFKNIENNIRFVPTCTLDVHVDRYKDFFTKYNIPEGAFVITYIGRHNEIKGYDVLKKIAERVLFVHENVYFVIAGKEEPLKGLKHKRWIELGWINNSHEIITHSDLFILPNQQTYFDLIFIEVLRAGTTILATYTGGNKFFDKELDKQETIGIKYFDQGDDIGAAQAIEDILKQDTNMLGKQNRYLWEKRFTLKEYVKNYTLLINDL